MMLIYYIEKLSFKSVIESMSQLRQLISITLFGAKKKKKKEDSNNISTFYVIKFIWCKKQEYSSNLSPFYSNKYSHRYTIHVNNKCVNNILPRVL